MAAVFPRPPCPPRRGSCLPPRVSLLLAKANLGRRCCGFQFLFPTWVEGGGGGDALSCLSKRLLLLSSSYVYANGYLGNSRARTRKNATKRGNKNKKKSSLSTEFFVVFKVHPAFCCVGKHWSFSFAASWFVLFRKEEKVLREWPRESVSGGRRSRRGMTALAHAYQVPRRMSCEDTLLEYMKGHAKKNANWAVVPHTT